MNLLESEYQGVIPSHFKASVEKFMQIHNNTLHTIWILALDIIDDYFIRVLKKLMFAAVGMKQNLREQKQGVLKIIGVNLPNDVFSVSCSRM